MRCKIPGEISWDLAFINQRDSSKFSSELRPGKPGDNPGNRHGGQELRAGDQAFNHGQTPQGFQPEVIQDDPGKWSRQEVQAEIQ